MASGSRNPLAEGSTLTMLMMKTSRRKLQLAGSLDDLRFWAEKPDDADDADGSIPLRANQTSQIVFKKRRAKLRVRENTISTVSIVRVRYFGGEPSIKKC